MTKEEILSFSIWRLRIAIALKLGIAVYCHKNRDSCALCFMFGIEPSALSLNWWQSVTDPSVIPDEGTLNITDGKYWYATRVASIPYLLAQITGEERDRFIEALMEICKVNASLVYISGERWADFPSLWRLTNASDEQQMRAWLIAKECLDYSKTNG